MKRNESAMRVVAETIRAKKGLSLGIVLAVGAAVAASLCPPLLLGRVIDAMTAGEGVPAVWAIGYFALLALAGLMEAARESGLTVFGQAMTHALRSRLMEKMTRLSADELSRQEPGAVAARFVSDVDTVESLFTGGIAGMAADACKIFGILAVTWLRNRGLALVLLLLLPFLFWFTRRVQRGMLAAQMANRRAVGRASSLVPETLKCIRTIRCLGKEDYMAGRYDEAIDAGYRAMEKANLMSNSFITIQEDSIHFDQIKGAEMLAFFDSKGELERFDVLGGASAVFFLEENECLATVNKSESKMISASFSNGEIQRVYYFDEVKNDGYPVVQMTQDEQRLKGFVWYPERRPKDRNDITTLSLRPSQRKSYKSRPRAKFTQTDIYFPGYMKDVYKRIHIRDSINAIRQREREMMAATDTVKTMPQVDYIPSSALVDSLAQQPELQQPDSLSSVTPLPQDSSFVLTELPDTTINKEEKLSKAEKKALKKKEAEKKHAAKQKALEEKWKRLDERDAARAKARQEKKLQKLRKKKRKAYLDYLEQTRKDAELLEKYIEKYRGKKSLGVSARKAEKDGEDGQNSQGERIVEVRND